MKRNIGKTLLLFCFTIAVIGVGGLIIEKENQAQDAVQVVSQKMLIPGGQSIGVKMNVKGVLVVGLEEIETADSVESPGFNAGIQIGDKILSIDNKEVLYAEDVTALVSESGNTVKIKVCRKDEELEFKVTPAKDYSSGEYKLGIWVKEKIAGIGTLSFYDPETNIFGSLGHGIYETKTKVLLEVKDGELLWTEVKSIKEGVSGSPGEIRGIFYDGESPVGSLYKNSAFGLFAAGIDVNEKSLGTPMPIAYKEQIKKGEAYILTTLDGNKVEKFDIKITGINTNSKQDNKGIEIEVIDKELLENCGGIVQGMSGSPIIQDGKLLGAVTHVLVNDPTRGYGIFIENMLEAAG